MCEVVLPCQYHMYLYLQATQEGLCSVTYIDSRKGLHVRALTARYTEALQPRVESAFAITTVSLQGRKPGIEVAN